MKISEKDWKNYISRLRRVNDLAAQKVADYMAKVDINTAEGMKQLLDYSYAVATRYGEAATELACQMYDAVATVSKVSIPSAEPAETATYGEVIKAIKGKMFDTKDPSAVGSAVGRLVKMAGVDTTMKNALRDGAEWAWIPSGDTCAFCLMLASRGWQKASRNAIRRGHAEHIHHNCDCTYQIRFDESLQVEGYDPDALYDEYIGAGETRQERLNTIRRKLYAKNPDYYRAQKRAAYARRKATLYTYDDPIREKIGSAEKSHPDELRTILDALKDNGVEIKRKPGMAYQPNPFPGQPGKIIMEEGASISAWKHEYKHFEDDKASNYTGFRLFADPVKAAEMEASAYDIEIEFARELGYTDVVERLEALKKKRLEDFR